MGGLLAGLQHSGLASLLDSSRYVSMGVQALHVLGFTFLLAVVLAFNLRIQKLALRGVTVAGFSRSINSLYYGSLAAALGGGILLFLPRSIAYGGNRALVFKLALLLVVIVLQYGLQRRAALLAGNEASIPLRVAAALTLLLWFVVGAAGRAIGFV